MSRKPRTLGKYPAGTDNAGWANYYAKRYAYWVKKLKADGHNAELGLRHCAQLAMWYQLLALAKADEEKS